MSQSDDRRNGVPQSDANPLDSTSRLSAIGADAPGPLDHRMTQQDRAAIGALPDGSALLIVRKGPNVGARFLLDSDETTSGRSPRSDIFLDDVTVSRRHAVFQRRAGGFIVRDMGSLNGTYVNRQRIEESDLENGDEVQIGKFRLTFHTTAH
jgi:pSer/pThr/pTyr-binding forkhead associated (FHA) protein